MEPTRDEVFAYVDAHPGVQPREIVKHFEDAGRPIDGSKVRVWLSRRARGEIATPATPPVAANKAASTVAGKWGEMMALPSRDEPRARATDRAAKPEVRKLAPEAKERFRQAFDGLTAFLATANDIAVEVEVIKANPKGDGGQIRCLDMKQYVDAAKALELILALAKGTDAFDSDTGGVADTTNDEAAQLAEAFGFKL